jgi:dipeptidyl aminopeptidase/acylaminoacyl peptidase
MNAASRRGAGPVPGLSERAVVPVLVVAVLCATSPLRAQRGHEDAVEPYTIQEVLSAPFPSELVAAPNGRAVAWIGNEEGRRNLWLAEAPAWRARRLTRWLADDGQSLASLTWTGDSRALLVVRGGAPGSNWDSNLPANPESDPRGTEQAVWLVPRVGVARRIGEGHTPVSSPSGERVVFLLRDTLRVAPLRVAGPPQVLLRMRGAAARPVFSPDGSRLAIVSRRGDHSYIGVLQMARRTVAWVAPATWRDDFPRWSADGRRLAFIRREGGTFQSGAPLPEVAGAPLPAFRIVVHDDTGTREVHRSAVAPDGNLPAVAGEWSLLWAAGDTLLFAAEADGWLGIYRVVDDHPGGAATRLTPAGCEIANLRLSDDRGAILYDSNCGDRDRRHVQRIRVGSGEGEAITSGDGIEWLPAPLHDGRVAVLRSSARRPAAPALADAEGLVALDGWPLPPAFPLDAMVEPQAVVVRAADSTAIHLQLFLPPNHGGGRHPAILFLHGGPQRQMLLGWHDRGYYHNAYAFNQYLASRGFIVVSVNYRGGIGYGRAFREAPGRGRFGAAEYQDLLAAAAWLRGRSDVDTARIGLWGGSYGGYMTALGLARNSDWFAAGVDLHGVHDYGMTRAGPVPGDSALALARRSSPVAAVTTWRSPVLLIAGDDDRNVEFQQTTDLAVRLRRRGVRVEELVFPDDVHSFLLHRNWLAAYRAAAAFFAVTLGTAVR